MDRGARGEQNPGVPLNLGMTSFWRLGPVAMEQRACAKSPVLFESEVNMSARRKSAQETCAEAGGDVGDTGQCMKDNGHIERL